MLKFLKNNIKKFSTTLTDAKEGSNSKKDLSPEISDLVKRMNKNDNISNTELNKLITYFFNIKEIKPGLYVLNKTFTDGLCFDINKINVVIDENNDVVDILINLSDIVFDNNITITVSVKNFYEVFKEFKFKPLTIKEGT